MASILDRYGIKEVADVTFYKIDQNTGDPTTPVLFLDTLKVSTIEQTAETADARGGKGNPKLISWDYGKEITVNIEDALFSPKSMNLMFGSVDASGDMTWTEESQVLRTVPIADVDTTTTTGSTYFKIKGKNYLASNVVYYDATGTSSTTYSTSYAYAKGNISLGSTGAKGITISADSFPGTYYVVGDTYARSETTGEDQFFQFIIPKAKMSAEHTITLEAEGDPSVFNMTLTVLRPSDGEMMRLVQYDLD